MTAAESRALKKGTRVYWRRSSADSGIIRATTWDGVTIAWDNGHIASVHHGDMRQIERTMTCPSDKAKAVLGADRYRRNA
jgi:hypothetical protein